MGLMTATICYRIIHSVHWFSHKCVHWYSHIKSFKVHERLKTPEAFLIWNWPSTTHKVLGRRKIRKDENKKHKSKICFMKIMSLVNVWLSGCTSPDSQYQGRECRWGNEDKQDVGQLGSYRLPISSCQLVWAGKERNKFETINIRFKIE